MTSTDSVRRFARRLGLDLLPLTHKNADQSVASELLVLDLDNLPAEYKSKLLLRADAGELRGGIAVHSYNLTRVEVRALRTAGIRVNRRMSAAVFTPAVLETV